MINLTASFNDRGFVVRLGKIDQELRDAIFDKLEALTKLMYDKAYENLSGKILQTKSGDLRRDLHFKTTRSRWYQTGTVYIAPVSGKALALEYGSKGRIIEAINAGYLKFFWEKESRIFKGRPGQVIEQKPTKAYRYLQSALEDMPGQVYEGFNQVIDEVFGWTR